MDQLQYFRLFYQLSNDDYALISSNLGSRSCKKNDVIVAPGQVQKELLFVKRGVQMSYFESEEKIHVIAFTYEPNLCAIPESFSFQRPSPYFLKCLTDSEFNYISYDALQNLFDRSQSIERLFRKMTEAVLVGLINRHIELHSLSIEDRFKVFCQRSAHLLQLVPHKYLASYLNIDPTNFSKLYNNTRF